MFGGFLMDGRLYLMGEIGDLFEESWIFPLATTTLEGRTFPAPADPDRLLTAMYGASWRVPDPAFHFEPPATTVRRLNGWFRGLRVGPGALGPDLLAGAQEDAGPLAVHRVGGEHGGRAGHLRRHRLRPRRGRDLHERAG